MQQNEQIHVNQFWQQQSPQGFQLWKPANTWQANWQEETYNEIDQELNLRKIKLSNQKDCLRWGYTTKGMFTTKESYQILHHPIQINKDQLWDQVWQPKIWPKVSTFLWILSKKKDPLMG